MKCGIYKAQNKINGLVYIGQSVNILKRWNNHKNDYMTGNSKFYKAIQEFGWDNFEWSIIEECSKEKLEEREKYWIDYYDSINNGYNTIYGSPFLKNNFKKITQEQYDNLIQDLIEDTLSIEELGEKYSLNLSYIYLINRGEDGNKKENLNFPLRKNKSFISNENVLVYLDNIYRDLQENNLSFEEIQNKYNVGISTLYKINKGDRYFNKNFSYPLRELKQKTNLSETQVEEIINLLQNSNKTFDEIALKFDRDISVIWNINRGSTHYNSKIKYPIRVTNSIHFLTKEKVDEIKDKLKNTNITGLKLAEIYNVSKDAISDINTGKTWYDNNENYPIRSRKKKKN